MQLPNTTDNQGVRDSLSQGYEIAIDNMKKNINKAWYNGVEVKEYDVQILMENWNAERKHHCSCLHINCTIAREWEFITNGYNNLAVIYNYIQYKHTVSEQ